MQVLDGEGVAIRTGPESCMVANNCGREALTGGDVGQVLSGSVEGVVGNHDPYSDPSSIDVNFAGSSITWKCAVAGSRSTRNRSFSG